MESCVTCTGVHWKVAQATVMDNLLFKMGKGTRNQGVWMEDGSGGHISDLVFEGVILTIWFFLFQVVCSACGLEINSLLPEISPLEMLV